MTNFCMFAQAKKKLVNLIQLSDSINFKNRINIDSIKGEIVKMKKIQLKYIFKCSSKLKKLKIWL